MSIISVTKETAWSAALLLVILQLLLTASPTEGACSCQNGGKPFLPNNIFGICRCKCIGGYKGPKCQFVRKRETQFGLEDLLDATGRELSEGMKRRGNPLQRSNSAELGEEDLYLPSPSMRQSLLALLRLYSEELEEDPTLEM